MLDSTVTHTHTVLIGVIKTRFVIWDNPVWEWVQSATVQYPLAYTSSKGVQLS